MGTRAPPRARVATKAWKAQRTSHQWAPRTRAPPRARVATKAWKAQRTCHQWAPPPSCAERAFEGLWMATDTDGNDNLDAAEFGAVVDYGCDEDPDCTPEDAEMAKGWFEEVTGGEPVPKDEVKDFMWEMGAEEFESENDSELCHMADEVEMYLDDARSGTDEPPASG